jgi:REP element-mobilizing transposase RayT
MAPRKPQMSFDFRRRRKDGKLAKKPGRKPAEWREDVPHRTREEIDARKPVHVTLRVVDAVRNLRNGKGYQAVRRALQRCAARSDYRVCEISIQDSHIHLIAEAESKEALARGMQGFEISAAKQLNRALKRKRGTVFPKRYHATVIETPTQMRNTLVYVFNNWKKHRADARERAWKVDFYSSAPMFDGWKTPHGHDPPREALPVVRAQSWLLREGWKRRGLIRLDEVPRE